MMAEAAEILEFWFGKPGEPGYGQSRAVWFQAADEFDHEIRARFFSDYEAAAAGERDEWKESPESCLALIILLDQFPRNLFREDARAYASDSRALAAAQHAVGRGFDQSLLPVQRWFVYLPFEHSEDREMQKRAVELFQALPDHPDKDEVVDFALRHQRVIDRFGRFPHRNADLGRESTAEELAFLRSPDAPF